MKITNFRLWIVLEHLDHCHLELAECCIVRSNWSMKCYAHIECSLKERWIQRRWSCHYCITSYMNMRERKRRSRLGICPVSLSSHLLQNPQTSPCTSLLSCIVSVIPALEASAIFLIDVPVTLLLHPVLQNHGYAENQDEVDTDNTKGCGEDLVEVAVGKRREGTNASTLLSCNKSISACRVLDKWRCSGINISAAVELVYVSTSLRFHDYAVPTFCCKRDWICGISRPQRTLKFWRVCRVSTQMATPRPSVKVAQTTTSQP